MPWNGALTGDRDWSSGSETAGGGQSGVRLAASYPGHKSGANERALCVCACGRISIAHLSGDSTSQPPWDLPRVCEPPGAGKQEREPVPTKRSKGVKAATTRCARASSRPKHNHSKIATDLFKEWFYANLRHPFPSDEVKAEFADRTGERQAYREQTPQCESC
jgi:hypothetical protein